MLPIVNQAQLVGGFTHVDSAKGRGLRGDAETSTATVEVSPAAVVQFGTPARELANQGKPGDSDSRNSEESSDDDIFKNDETAFDAADIRTDTAKIAAKQQASNDEADTPFFSRTLTPEQQLEVDQLRRHEQSVRAEQLAAQTAAGSYSRDVRYEYANGPDGQRYIRSGKVNLDSAPIPDDPSSTLKKMKAVMQAASVGGAVADASVTVRAAVTAQQAVVELSRKGLGIEPVLTSQVESSPIEPSANDADESSVVSSTSQVQQNSAAQVFSQGVVQAVRQEIEESTLRKQDVTDPSLGKSLFGGPQVFVFDESSNAPSSLSQTPVSTVRAELSNRRIAAAVFENRISETLSQAPGNRRSFTPAA